MRLRTVKPTVGALLIALFLATATQVVAAPGNITSPAPGATLTNTSQAFAWSAGTGATGYMLRVGNAVGGSDIYLSPQTTALSATATNLPMDGRKLYVRLGTLAAGVWTNKDYTY